MLIMGKNLIYGFGQNNCQQVGRYKEDFLITPKKWNHTIDTFFKNDIKTDEKILIDIKCSNEITCLLFKNKSQLEGQVEEEKNYYEIDIKSEESPLKHN